MEDKYREGRKEKELREGKTEKGHGGFDPKRVCCVHLLKYGCHEAILECDKDV